MPASDQIVVSGAREHNLKDISLALPRDALVVITGLSGSGKSSLAFDTIYAEGQRRYVESLSAYARQFLGQMDKPDVDSIEGLSPAISIDQKTTSRNPRSTVGTVTEIYDYLRLLWSRVGKPHCPICGRPIVGQSAEQIIDQVMELADGTRFMVLAPVVRGRKGEYGKLLAELRADGFARVKVDERGAHARGVDRARQALQARHLGRRRPAGDAPRPAQAAGRLDRDGGRPRGRARGDRDRRLRERARAVTPPAPRARAPRPRRSCRASCPSRERCTRSPSASPVPSTDRRWWSSSRGSSRSTPPTAPATGAPGSGSQMEIDPRAARARPDAVDRRGRDRALGQQRVQLLRAGGRGDRRALRRRPGRALGGAARGAARPVPVRDRRRAPADHLPQPLRAHAHLRDARSRASSTTSSAATARRTPS